MDPSLDMAQLEKASFILKTIAHPLRLGIVQLLGEHDRLTVSEICSRINCEQSLTSHHLNTMKLKGILQSQREGKHIHYSLKLKEIMQVVKCVGECSDCL